MADEPGDKTHEPTPHRRQQARQQGHVARSQDLASAILLLGGLGLLLAMGSGLVACFAGLALRHLGGKAWLSVNVEFLSGQWNDLAMLLAAQVLPLLGGCLLLAVAVNVMQVGFLFLPEKLAPDLSRIDPLKGLGRLVSLGGLARLAFGLLKLVLAAAVAWYCLAGELETILSLPRLELGQVSAYLVELLVSTGLKIGGALLLLAVLDYGFQRWRHEHNLRMTAQELREEMRNLQGSPQIVARRRAVQRQLVLSRSSSAVPEADVVITNPTELAVAIQYDPLTMNAPVVVAKGAGILAERIRRLAIEHGVPIVEKEPLAQALFKLVEVQQAIGRPMYAAVAEVLAYAYQLKRNP